MARHAAPKKPAARRTLVALATAGVALGAGATTAAADSEAPQGPRTTRPASLGAVDPQTGAQPLTGTVGHVAGPVSGLKPNPLAGTGVDPLDNGVGTQVADFKPVDSRTVTRPVAQAQSVDGVPVVGRATGMLGG
ncbi:hypothetical protein OH738_15045 [Streptomyces hirsutus]|uniref:ATP-binding protein n=1 Tax=Streptomyces hirsutus TaxID=35620 RepID=A0ABZ1GQU8_9ACTN|nr:hypothetical protein [Streptomyces hirsutus]WSD08551.1 hypothetical protein OIE73_24360 [Streptomyces hirsutus]WTD17989.1 hypothetical protein OH738_15045 [Streptomyces hirsutus]WTD77110.1 hypothetical protein OHB56_26555 [Streptomyces sp. NBC_01635]